jgi:hypothetical protein
MSQTTKPLMPRSPPIMPPGLSPVFQARFSDKTKVRMSVYSASQPLDVKRAVKVAHAAYASRHHIPISKTTITEARFEKDGKVLAEYTAEQLAKVTA